MQLCAASMARVELRLLQLLQILGIATLLSAQITEFDFSTAVFTTDPTFVDKDVDDTEETNCPFDHTKVDICDFYPEGES